MMSQRDEARGCVTADPGNANTDYYHFLWSDDEPILKRTQPTARQRVSSILRETRIDWTCVVGSDGATTSEDYSDGRRGTRPDLDNPGGHDGDRLESEESRLGTARDHNRISITDSASARPAGLPYDIPAGKQLVMQIQE